MNIHEFFAENNLDERIRNTYFPDYTYKGTVIEVGAATPSFLSFSKHFALNGWRAILIEPNPYFVEQHKKLSNEIYEYACSYEDADNVDFTIYHQNIGDITDHSFSSFYLKEEYQLMSNNIAQTLNTTSIKVKTRTLDTIIKETNISNIDILSIDVEGWELEVLRGLTIMKPKIIILENLFNWPSYREYVCSLGYTFVKHDTFDDIYSL